MEENTSISGSWQVVVVVLDRRFLPVDGQADGDKGGVCVVAVAVVNEDVISSVVVADGDEGRALPFCAVNAAETCLL